MHYLVSQKDELEEEKCVEEKGKFWIYTKREKMKGGGNLFGGKTDIGWRESDLDRHIWNFHESARRRLCFLERLSE